MAAKQLNNIAADTQCQIKHNGKYTDWREPNHPAQQPVHGLAESVDELEAYIRSENQSLSQADLDYYS